MNTNDAFAWTEEDYNQARKEINQIKKSRDVDINNNDSILTLQVKAALQILNECNFSPESISLFFNECLQMAKRKNVSIYWFSLAEKSTI